MCRHFTTGFASCFHRGEYLYRLIRSIGPNSLQSLGSRVVCRGVFHASLRLGGSSAHAVYDPCPHMSAHPMSAHCADHLQIFGGGRYTPICATDTSFGGRGLETGLAGDAGMTPTGQNSCQNTQHFDKSGINSEIKRPVMRISWCRVRKS
jgi:hypothetical protein